MRAKQIKMALTASKETLSGWSPQQLCPVHLCGQVIIPTSATTWRQGVQLSIAISLVSLDCSTKHENCRVV